jgi:hypothetical protein
VQEARRRTEGFVANARTQTADPSPSEKEAAEATDLRAMKRLEPSARRHYLISTSRRLLVFVGLESEDEPPGNFLLVPASQYPR